MAVVVPGRRGALRRRQIIVAMVTSIWKSTKKPKLVTSPFPLSHLIAFRCCQLEPCADSVSRWEASEKSIPWVLKPEAILAVLAPFDAESVDLGTEKLIVRLSGDSVQLLDGLSTASECWPTPEDEPSGDQGHLSGLFVSRRKGRKRGAAVLGQHAKIAKVATSIAKSKKKMKGAKKKQKAAKKSEKKKTVSLRKAAEEKQIDFESSNCRRNGVGPVLVLQMMNHL